MKNLKNYIYESVWDVDNNVESDNNEFVIDKIKQFIKDNYLSVDLKRLTFVFDKEKKGFFEVEYFKKLMLSLQEKLTLEEISDMIKEADPDNTGYINYKNFVNSVLIR